MASVDRSRAWQPHPWLARLLRVAIFVAPIALSTFVTRAFAKSAPDLPTAWHQAGWITFLLASGTVLFYAGELLMRRLLPLTALLRLTLVFPDHAPARFAVALRTGTPKQLARQVKELEHESLGDTPQEAAERVLELVAALSQHDRLTRGHCERVRAYTDMIATEMDLPDDARSKLHWAGMIHDIGKLAVPTEILNKPGRLTDEEFEVIKSHPEAGARIAAPLVEWLGEWFHAIDEHHEKWDGSGYPRGLAGKEISLAGRIVAVADVFDVITAARSYKKPQPASDARAELARCAGTHFDPTVVRAFLGISLSRLRVMLGPLAWLSELPALGRVPMGSAAGTAVGAAFTATALAVGGFLGLGTEPEAVSAARVAEEEPITTSAPTTTTSTTTTTTPAEAPTVVAAAARPQANDDEVTVDEDGTATIDVLANDEGSGLRIVDVREPAGASAVVREHMLDFRPPLDMHGDLTFEYVAATRDGVQLTATVLVRVRPVNDAPDFEIGDPISLLEDAGASSIPGWVSDIRSGPANESAQTVRFEVVAVDAWMFEAQPAVDADGTLTLRPATNRSGVTDVQVTAVDSQGARSVPRTAQITIAAVNDPPSFDLGPAVAVNEDSGAHVVDTWLTNISPGPFEADQSVTFDVVTDTPALFAVPPAISATGRLTFTPAADANGTAAIAVTATDSAGWVSASQSSTIAVAAVNDPPVLAVPGSTTVAEDSGVDNAHAHDGWVSSISAGPADEAGQTVTYVVTADDGSLFYLAPEIDTAGRLTYTLAPHANGSTTLRIVAWDSGGAGSAEQVALLAVTPVQDPPVPGDDAVLITDGLPISIAVSDVLANDSDDDGESLTVQSVAPTASPSGNPVGFDGTTITYDPGFFVGTDTITYMVSDGTTAVQGTIVVTVDTLVEATNFYMHPGSWWSDTWSLINAMPGGSGASDYDFDLRPGLTIEHSGGSDDEDDPAKYQDFVMRPTVDVDLNGPVVLDLWSSVEGFDPSDDAHLYAYVDRCDDNGSNCVALRSMALHVDNWNQGQPTWTRRTFSLGTITTTVTDTQMLRVRLLFGHKDVWIAMSDQYPSYVELPIVGP